MYMEALGAVVTGLHVRFDVWFPESRSLITRCEGVGGLNFLFHRVGFEEAVCGGLQILLVSSLSFMYFNRR